jgi:hypothetical protein
VTTLAKAFIELASYLSIAKFDDPDEAQGAEELVSSLLLEASPDERVMLSQVARRRAEEEVTAGAPEEVVRFYKDFASKADYYQKYGWIA